MNSYPSLLRSNVDTLNEGLALLQELTPSQYVVSQQPAFLGTIGAHYRHLLEHYRCFLEQLGTQAMCFDSRAREFKLENDHVYALQTMHEIISAVSAIDVVRLDETLLIQDQQTDDAVHSSVARELLFLQSHTVHHYAMIAAMARLFGLRTRPGFGVAIATKVFQQDSASKVG